VKVLVLSQYWWPENGVPQRRWQWLTEMLHTAGHEVTVISPPAHYHQEISLRAWLRSLCQVGASTPETGPAGETIIRSWYFPATRSLTSRVINQAVVAIGAIGVLLVRRGGLRNFQPDIIVGTIPALPTAFVTDIASKLLRVPYAVDLRDAWPDLLEESDKWNVATGPRSRREKLLRKGPLQIARVLTRFWVNRALNNASGIIVTSSYLERDLRQRLEEKTSSTSPRIITVRNVFPPKSRVERKKYAEPTDGEFRVLYAGTIGRAQRLDNALQAAKIAYNRGLNIKVRIVGTGASAEILQKSANGRMKHVQFVPHEPAENLEPHYSWADTALVHLTDWEPLRRAVPSKTYELMDNGVHITAAVSGEAAAVIRELGAGDVVSPENPEELAELWIELAQQRKRLEVADTGQRWVRDIRDTQVPAQLLAFLEEVAGAAKK